MNDPTSHDTEVLVLQHLHEDGPGHLGDWLNAQGVRWRVLCTEAGEVYPATVRGLKGLAVLGGAWSANDDRPSLRQAEALIREADALGIPVIGHCLGGQLIARAFGGQVQTLDTPEIGWLPIRHDGSAAARDWLGDAPDATVYQWHYDSFTELPPGAQLVAGSAASIAGIADSATPVQLGSLINEAGSQSSFWQGRIDEAAVYNRALTAAEIQFIHTQGAAGKPNDLGNELAGVHIVGSGGNLVGGSTPGARNVIGANFRGVWIAQAGSNGNKVQGNYLGLNAAGSWPASVGSVRPRWRRVCVSCSKGPRRRRGGPAGSGVAGNRPLCSTRGWCRRCWHWSSRTSVANRPRHCGGRRHRRGTWPPS